ncbi:BQ2448_1013 [Microbotryum intermedium]|uniref:BQ2448_1013 protein n=1 Tax=Microbotryum intermedium TaxID=269621 RepID=A0A238F4H9_9BASI|nr:BQ2448_1013 [Microbotryum intermedium]
MIRLGSIARTTTAATAPRVGTASFSTTRSIRNLDATPRSSAASDESTPPSFSTSEPSSSLTTQLSQSKPESKPTWTRSSSQTPSSTPSILPHYPALDALTAFAPIPVLPSSTHCATLTLRSYTPSLHHLTFYIQFVLRSARALGLRTLGPHPLPLKTQLITVPRSPFVHKKSQQNFWRKTHARKVDVFDAEEGVLDLWLAYLRKEAMGGVGVKVQRFGYREIGWASGDEGVEERDKMAGGGAAASEEEVESLAKELEGELMLSLQQEQEQEREQGEKEEAQKVEEQEQEEQGQEEEVKEGTTPKVEDETKKE